MERRTFRSRAEFPDLRAQGSRYRSMPQWTTNVSKCPSNMQMETRDFKLPCLRRRAAMTRAVLPNTPSREQWLLAGLIDRTTNSLASSTSSGSKKKTRMPTLEPTQQSLMTMTTSRPSQVNRPPPSTPTTSDLCTSRLTRVEQLPCRWATAHRTSRNCSKNAQRWFFQQLLARSISSTHSVYMQLNIQ